jgi:hypothetical protein
MLHLVYILAFTIIAFFAISNLIRSLITISTESQKGPWTSQPRNWQSRANSTSEKITHPELLDNSGNPINEPLLVIRSVSVEDAREKLDSIYNSSPSQTKTAEDEQ